MDRIALPESWKSWQIRRTLGEGAYGTVYLAEKQIGADVSASAIKVIRIHPDENEARAVSFDLGPEQPVREYYADMARSYIQEIRTMIALKGHPNIVYIEDYAVEEDPENIRWTIYIRMEILTPFTEYAQTHPMAEADVIRLGTDLCAALTACAEKGIIHRDIKPSNIFISPATGQFKLGDFGVARRMDRSSGMYSAKGTFPYMAPEVFQHRPYDQRSDLYSLGLVLYHLLNRNREPFVDMNKQIVYVKDREAATARRMSGEALPPPAEAGPETARVILKACDPDPDRRYPDAEAFREALEKAGNSGKSPGKSGRKWLWVIPAVILAAAAILLLNGGRKEKPAETGTPAATVTTEPIPVPTRPEEPEATATPVWTNTPEPEKAETPEPETPQPETPEPAPALAEINISSADIVPVMDGRKLLLHPENGSCTVRIRTADLEQALRDAGCVLSEAEWDSIRESLKMRFFAEGSEKAENGEEFAEGDVIRLVFRPDESLAAALAEKGFRLIYTDREFVAVQAGDGKRLRLEPAEK